MENWKNIIGAKFKSTIVVFVCLIMIGTAVWVVSTPGSEGASVNTFKGGNDYNITFSTPGIDATPTFSVENKVPIIDAQMKISTADKGDGNYPISPKVDVGIDGDTEWAYTGNGYGQFGMQTKFNDNTSSATSEFTSAGGTKTTANFLMPKGATATSASMDVRGRFVPTSINEYEVAETGLRYPRYSHAGNIDNTNNEDVVVSCYDYANGQIYWFKNPSPATNTWTKNTIAASVAAPYDVQIGNIQETISGQTGGDDVVTASYNYYGNIYWYCNNNNNGASWTRYTVASNLMYPAYVRIADMDQDGDNDIAFAAYGYYTYYSSTSPMVGWYENDGTPKTGAWTVHAIYTTGSTYYDGYIRGFDVGFFDSDAYPDAVWGAYRDLRWAKNPQSSTGTWSSYKINSGYYYYPYGIMAADIDGDGDDDIGTCSGYSSTGYGVAWWKNPGTTSTWTKYNVDTNARYGYDIEIKDFDGANTVDFIVVTYGWSTGYDYIYRYLSTSTNPTGAWTKQTISNNVFKSPATVTAANFDGANRDDFFVASYYTGSASWFANNGAATSWAEDKIIEGGMMDPYGMDQGDIDGDGDPDLVVCGYGSDEIKWYKNDGNPASGTWQAHQVDSNADAAQKCKIVDIDGDSDLDIVATLYYAYDLVVYINSGTGTFTKKIVDANLMYVYPIDVADIDKDGHLDIITAAYYSSYGGLVWYEAPNTPTGTWIKRTIDASANYVRGVAAGDIDQDGDMDVAAITYSYSGGTVKWYECPANPKGSSNWASTDVQSGIQYGYDIAMGDIDWDGQLDVVYTERYYDVWWNKCPDNPKSTPWNQYNIATFSSYYPWNLDLKDIGNDGYWDVAFTTGYSGRLYWAEEPDDPTKTWKLHTVDTNLDYSQGCVIGDFDEDGVEDIAATGSGMEEVKWYKIQTSYCEDPKLDVGGDSLYEWQTSNQCIGDYHLEFKDPMNLLLGAAGTGTVDAYGNEMVSYPVQLTVGPHAGKITIHNISMEYEYTATVDINPHNTNLATEIQEFLDNDQSGAENMDLFIALGSASPGKMRVHDLEINYNGHPTLDTDIPTIKIDEDSTNGNVLDLSNYFSDDFDTAADLTYTLDISAHSASRVQMDITGTIISADTVIPNWNGQITVGVTATDNGDGVSSPTSSTKSNAFDVIIEPVNDEPTVGDVYIPNARLDEESYINWVDLDNAKYFIDIEYDELYYKAEVDPDGAFADEDLTVSINADHVVMVKSNGDFTGVNIPIRILADDDPTFGELNEVNPYQDFKVTVDNIPDDPPFWTPIDPIYVPEDTELTEVLDLMDYVNDPDTPLDQLEIYLTGNTNSSWLPASINEDGKLSVASAQPDYDGSTMLTVKAWDGYNYGLTTIWVYVLPENDLPTVKITVPYEGETISFGSLFTVIGSAKDPEDLQKVEIGIAEKGKPASEWMEVKGLTSWNYAWNTEELEGGTEWTLYARSYDGVDYSEIDFVNVKLEAQSALTKNTDNDPVPDAFDPFPENPYEWEDKDGDGYGDNQEDAFPEDRNEWQDSDHDGVGDKSDPTRTGEKLATVDPGDYQGKESESGLFSLWWLVLILVFIEVCFLVFLLVKKVRSKKPVPKKITKQKKKAE